MTESYLNCLKKIPARKSLNKSNPLIEIEEFIDEQKPIEIVESNSNDKRSEINNNNRTKHDNGSNKNCEDEYGDLEEEEGEDEEGEENSSIDEIEEGEIVEKDSTEKYPENDDHQNLNTCNQSNISQNLPSPKKTTTNSFNFYNGILIVVIALFLPSLVNILSGSKKEQKSKKFDSIDQLKQKYPNQTSTFWTNIESSYKHSVIKSKDPSIVVLVYDRETESLYEKISRDILLHLNSSEKLNEIIINLKIDKELKGFIESSKFDETKYYIDNKLENIFRSGKKIALVENIQNLPAYSMILFYTYGDDFINAKFPGIMIFMSLRLDDEILSKISRDEFLTSSKKLTKFTEDYLFDIWSKDIPEDQLRPLFTRIANNVILLNTEL